MDVSGLDRKKVLNGALALQGVFAFCFAISAFVVAGNANQGFNVVIEALAFIGFVVAAFQVINKRQTPLAVGTIIGVSFVLVFTALMSAIFWGELSKCEDIKVNVDGYSCEQVPAMRAVCTFAVFLFLLGAAFTALLILWRDEVLQEASTYDQMPKERESSTSSSAQPYPAAYDPAPTYNKGASADL